jgi:hypothetical protein
VSMKERKKKRKKNRELGVKQHIFKNMFS